MSRTGLRAIMVAVDYSDLLAVTLPYNRHHFDEVHIVVDSKTGPETAEVIGRTGNDDGKVRCWETDLFYADGAKFNKWRALEWGLDRMGRHGWICNMDADVLWPKGVDVVECDGALGFNWGNGEGLLLERGELMTPLRRMAPWPLVPGPGKLVVPPYGVWQRYPIHRNVREWAGYSQVFHASDPVLGPPPWHEVDWTHAGGADSLFQRKWPAAAKVRPAWEVLHLGEAGANWFGRAAAYGDGSVPQNAAELRASVAGIWRGRAERRRLGMSEAETFRPEKLG